MAIEQYISNLQLAEPSVERVARRRGPGAAQPEADVPLTLPDDLAAAVDLGSVLSFVDGVGAQEKEDILFSVQLAQRAASAKHDRFAEARAWYLKYIEVLEVTGWAAEQFAFVKTEQTEGEFRMDKAALAIIAAIATQNQLAVLKESITALEKLADDDGAITLFDFHSSTDMAGNFQIGAVQKGESGTLSLALGAFHFRSVDKRRKFLFFKWGQSELNFWTAAQKMTFNTALYDRVRDKVRKKLGAGAVKYVDELDIAP